MLTISSAEWEVMRVLWAKGQATSSEIIAILAKRPCLGVWRTRVT